MHMDRPRCCSHAPNSLIWIDLARCCLLEWSKIKGVKFVYFLLMLLSVTYVYTFIFLCQISCNHQWPNTVSIEHSWHRLRMAHYNNLSVAFVYYSNGSLKGVDVRHLDSLGRAGTMSITVHFPGVPSSGRIIKWNLKGNFFALMV